MSIPSSTPKDVRVAIVGSGLTGLVATYLLTASDPDSPNAPRIAVEIFERAPTLGMDSASISVPLPISQHASLSQSHPILALPADHDQEDASNLRSRKRLKLQTHSILDPAPKAASFLRIDVPMRAFTGGYYPQLLALYRHLGIRTRKTNFTYSFASLPPTIPASPSRASSSASLASSSSTRSSSPTWRSEASHKANIASPPAHDTSSAPAPSPSILYNGANGFRGVSIPAELRHPRLTNPVKISSIVGQVDRLRVYFASLLALILGYLQLLIIALWHHWLGHTCDSAHPLRTHTLSDLVREPFPSRVGLPKGSSLTLGSRVGFSVERLAETILRRLVCLDRHFAEQTLAPLFSAVMTSTLDSVWACPATEVLDYIALTLGKDHFVVKDGVRTVVASLLRYADSSPQISPPSSSSTSNNTSSKVWTDAEVRHVQSKDGKTWIDVMHHAPSIPRPSSADSTETEDMSRQPSSSSTDRTLCNDDEQAQQHGPFDHVIFATQANQTAHFLRQYIDSLETGAKVEDSEEARRLRAVVDTLETFKYEKSIVVNHTDRGLLPAHKADWRDLNLVSPGQTEVDPKQVWQARCDSGGSDWTDDEIQEADCCDTLVSSLARNRPSGYTMATHVLSTPAPDVLIMQTTNPHASLHPRPATVLSRSTFERAVIDVEAHVARQSLFTCAPESEDGTAVETAGGRKLVLGGLQKGKAGRVWVCGSWAVGIPLLEGCIASARLIAQEILRLEGGEVAECARW